MNLGKPPVLGYPQNSSNFQLLRSVRAAVAPLFLITGSCHPGNSLQSETTISSYDDVLEDEPECDPSDPQNQKVAASDGTTVTYEVCGEKVTVQRESEIEKPEEKKAVQPHYSGKSCPPRVMAYKAGQPVLIEQPYLNSETIKPEGADLDLVVGVATCDDELIQKALSEGANVNVLIGSGHTPLMLAVRRNDYDMAEMLLVEGADPNVKAPNGLSTLIFAAHYADLKMAELLRKYDADPLAHGPYGKDSIDFSHTYNVPVCEFMCEEIKGRTDEEKGCTKKDPRCVVETCKEACQPK